MTVAHAIQRGHRVITLPALILVLVLPLGVWTSLLLMECSDHLLGFGITFVAGMLFATIFGGLAQTKWRIWAFTNVADIRGLEQAAIREKLYYPSGHWLGKLVIGSSEDKRKLAEIDQWLKAPNLFQKVFVDDPDVPETTVVYYSKGGNLFDLLLMLGLAVATLAIAVSTGSYVVMVAGSLFFLWEFWKSYERLTNRNSQLILGENGIQFQKGPLYPWDRIRNEEIVEEGGKRVRFYLSYQYRDEHEEEFNGESRIPLENYDISAGRLEHLLEIYRARYESKLVNRK